jgi:hypothetical protein
MALADLIKPIMLPKEQLRTLGGVLTELVQDLESAHSRYFDNIRVWWKWYEAEPRTQSKVFPFPHASNVVAPVIKTQADSRTAQDFSMIWGSKDKLYVGKSPNEQFTTKYLASVMDYANWCMDAEVNPFWCLHDWLKERNVLGCSVFSVSWEEKERFVFAPGSRKPEKVVLRRGVKWNHHPAEKILWEPGCPIKDSDRVITQRLLNGGDIAHMLQEESGYYKDSMLSLLNFPHIHGSSGAQVQAEKEERAGIDSAYNVSRRRIFDARTLWLDWPIIGGLGVNGLKELATIEEEETGERTRVPLIVELAPDTQTVLRVLPNPYLMADGNPFFDSYYQRQVGYARGIGLAKILEGPQRAQSTVINQAIDGRTLQNAIPFKTTDPKFKERPITPGQGAYVTNMTDIEPFAIPSGSPFDLGLANMMQVWAERSGGTNDPVLGRESRSGGHPSPATNYMGQLEQSAKMGSVSTFIMDEQLAAAGLYTLALYQQFDTDEGGRLQRVFGAADAGVIREWLFPTDMSLVGNLQLSLTATSDQNPQQAMQKAMMVAQFTQQYFGNILKLIQVLSMPQVPDPVKKAAIQCVKVLGDVQQDFLEVSGYDEAREAVLRLDQGDMNAIAQLSAIAQQAGQQQLGPGDGGPGPGGPGPPPSPAQRGGNGAVPPSAGGPPPSGPPGPPGGL